MGLFSGIFGKKSNKSLSFPQADNFRGFKKVKITSYQFEEAERNLNFLKEIELKKNVITLSLIRCSNNTEAIEVFVDDLIIGTIFFGSGNYQELLSAFKTNQIEAVYVKIEYTDAVPNYRPDAYLLVKYGG